DWSPSNDAHSNCPLLCRLTRRTRSGDAWSRDGPASTAAEHGAVGSRDRTGFASTCSDHPRLPVARFVAARHGGAPAIGELECAVRLEFQRLDTAGLRTARPVR